jgi:type I restriction enzyme S subunit
MQTTVGEIATSIQYGHTASATDDLTGPRFLRITDIQDGQVDWNAVPSCDIATDEIEKYRLKLGDIVFARTGATTGKSYLIRNCPDAVFASYLIRLRMHDRIFPAYVQAFFQTSDYWRQIEGGKRGIGQPNVNASVLATIELPIAPLNEQARIVAKIEELFSDLDAGVAALKRDKANLKRYRASVLKSAVEGKLTEQWRAKHPAKEPASALLAHILLERRQKWEADQLAKFAAAKKEPPKNWRDKYVQPSPPDSTCLQELPEGWCWGSLEQLTSAVRPICYGILMPKENVAEGVPYVRVKDMKGDRIDVLNLHRTRPEIAAEYARATLIPGDWLLAIRGTYGRLAEVPPELEGGNITQDTARLAVANDISAGFVATALRSSLCQLFFKRVARGVAVKGVNIGDVRLCPIPIGPKEEQLQILQMVSERLSQIDAAEKQIEHGLLRASRLRQSILKRAFEGKLVPQDPKDEPASALLERLRTSRTHDEANGTAATSKPNRAKIKESSGEPRTQIRRRASTRNQQEE